MLNVIDFECFRYDWLCVIANPITKWEQVIINDPDALKKHYETHKNEIYVTFNGRQYDDWIFKAILAGFDPWEMNNWLINKGRKGWEFSEVLRRISLNSYDCMVGFNGLKTLEGFMGVSIEESSVPFDIGRPLTEAEIQETVKYCRHDVENTIRVFAERKEEFDSYIGLLKMFDLPLSYMAKTKAQLSATILQARKLKHKDEFEISFPPTLKLKKYTRVLDFFKNDWDYDTNLKIDIAGVPHVYGTGGIHGAIPKYFGEGDFLHIDVNSYYPSLMITYPEYCMSRNIPDPSKFTYIRDMRLEYKRLKDPRQQPLKIVLNGTYGAMKDKFNPLYDPRQANNVCVFGQLLLTDLIEKLEGYCDLVQSNTDGLIVKLRNNYDEVVSICKEWEERTGMGLGYDRVRKIMQKDVNNYVMVEANGKIESKGAYVKSLNNLDYDLPIVNEAVVAYLLRGVPVETTIFECNDFRKFQKIVKLSNKYKWVEHERRSGNIKYDNKAYRVFASRSDTDGRLLKCDGVRNPTKFGNTPDKCFVENGDLSGLPVPMKLDRGWYVALAKKRLEDFGV